MPGVETVNAGALRLSLRPAVRARELAAADGPVFYLSLYDGELDERARDWAGARRMRTSGTMRSGAAEPRTLAADLEPTDAVVACADRGTIVIARGGCCTFPLY